MRRSLDLVVLAAAAPVAIPVVALTALALRASQGRPVLFRQQRLGRGGREFSLLKFRTMRDDRGPDGALLPDAVRMTRVGSVVRRLSLDELPQLVNIARGEMSFVGPRPLFTRYRPFYSAREWTRHDVRPGITGLAQTSGRNNASWHRRLELDARYAETATTWTDIRILADTVRQVVRGHDVVVVAGNSGDPLDVERSFPSTHEYALRRLYRRDLAERVKWMRDPSIRRYMQLPTAVTIDSTIQWYERVRAIPGRNEFAVIDGSGEVVAMCGLREHGDSTSVFNVMVAPGRHGRGIGRVSTRLVIEWARTNSALRAITLTVHNDNHRAVSIYKDEGFVVTSSTADRCEMKLELDRVDVK